MSGSTSVGVISLDLVIKEKLTEQLEKIRRTAEASVSKPFEEAEKKAAEALNETAKSAAKAVDETAKSAEKAAAKTREAFEKAAKPMKYEVYDSAAIQAQVDKIAEELSKPKQKFEELTQEMRDALGNYEVPTDKVERLNSEIELTQEKIGLLQAKWQELQASLSSAETDSAAAKIAEQINSIESRISSLYGTIETKRAQIDKLSDTSAQKDLRLTEMKEEYELRLEVLRERCEEQITSLKERNAAKLQAIEAQYAAKLEAADESRAAAQQKLHAKTAASLTSKVGGAFTRLRRTGTGSLNAIRSGMNSVGRAAGNLTAPVNKFGNSLKNAARRIFLMAGVLSVFKSMRSALTEAAKDNEDFAKSLNDIKANLSVAFQPIIDAAMPAINELMAGLAAATQQIAAFIAALFGTTYAEAAKKVKKTKELAKEAQKAAATYLNSYDEMNVAPSSSDKSSDSSDSESGGVDYSKLDPDVKLPDWAEKMKDAIRSGDWNGVGKLLADKVNKALGNIKWDKLKKKVKAGAKGLADGLNGFTDNLDWKLVGSTLAEGMNTALIGLDTFITTYHWDKLGSGIADMLNSAIDKADWGLVGKTLGDNLNAAIDTAYAFVTTFDFSVFGSSLSDSVNTFFETADFAKAGTTLGESIKGILDTGIAFLEGVNWQKVGTRIAEFLENIDWSGIASRAFRLLGDAIGAALSVLYGFIGKLIPKIQKHFEDEFDRMNTGNIGLDIVLGIMAGILDGFMNIQRWIWDHIYMPFISGIKNAFGINGSDGSKQMRSQGANIMAGLLGGISSKIAELKKKASELKDKFLAPVKEINPFINGSFKENFSKAWTGIRRVLSIQWEYMVEVVKAPVNKIIDIINGMTSAVAGGFTKLLDGIESVVNSVADAMNSLSFDIPDWVPEWGGNTYGFSIPYIDLPSVDIPEIPHLAKGGLVTQPTLAMVGDNPSAGSDPEAILPVSKLSEMLDSGRLAEAVELLREIADLIRSLDLTVIAKIDDKALFTIVQRLASEYKRRTGRSAFE